MNQKTSISKAMKKVQLCAALVVVSAAAFTAQGEGVPSFETFIAHRGESVDAPENTLPAYSAVAQGRDSTSNTRDNHFKTHQN